MATHEPTVAVVIPAYRSAATLGAVLDALEPQVAGHPGRTAVVVDSSADGTADALRVRHPWVQVIDVPGRAYPGAARNIGVAATTGDLIAFLDADALPAPDWLDQLVAALNPGADAVAGAILNGTPSSLVGTAGYLLEFSEWLPRRTRPLLHAATCNLLLRRSVFEAGGGFDDVVRAGEDTLVTFPLGLAGRLAFAPRAAIRHQNRTSLRSFLANQRVLGAAFVVICARVDFPYRAFARRSLAPLAGTLRACALIRRLARNPSELARALCAAPLIALGLVAWARGVARGPQPS